nr:hapless 2 [Leptinotarsa decemlineata]
MRHFALIFLFIYTIRTEEANLDERLSREEKNARCCAQHLSCCKKSVEPTNFEVRALLVKCRNTEKSEGSSESKKPPLLVQKSKRNAKEIPHCIKKDEGITNCKRKIKLTVKVKNRWITNCKNQYIVIDHVFDSITQQKQKLLNPYVLKIRQKPVFQRYELGFEAMVNSQAREKVHNKQEAGFTGCNVNPFKSPTCGVVKYKNEPVPFSTGFCCSCDKNKYQSNKIQRNSNDSDSFRVPLLNEVFKKTRNTSEADGILGNNFYFDGKSGNLQADPPTVNEADITGHNEDYSRPFQLANDQKLTVFDNFGHNIQKRGGQDCTDKYTPPNLDPETYHDSAHCLEFSDIWYGVYYLKKPKVHHSLFIQIFEKYQDLESTCKWRDLTKLSPIEIGTSAPSYVNDQATISGAYSAEETNIKLFSLNYKIHKLLIPDISNVGDVRLYPELRGGVGEYLVIRENQVQSDGKACNVAGVGYEAFAKQPNRCSVSKGSCLKNQPRDMWTHDHELEEAGRRGNYFLKNYGILPEEAVTSNGTEQNKTLRMFFTEFHTSLLDVEFKADRNTVLRPSSLATITEVYVDSSSPKKTSITAKIFNSGLVFGIFHVSLADCPLDLPARFNNINSKPALIPPQHQHIFHLDIVCPLPRKNFFCSLQVLNEKQELIALRKIRMEREDRCICIWHCACACFLADEGLKCKALSLENYHAAGFQGGLPLPIHVIQYTFLDDMISMMLYILLFLCFTLLLMGFTKASVGCCSVPVGLWGMDMVMDLPKRINRYQEADISHRSVVYDGRGWPVHPDTGERVRNIPLAAEFCTNVVFFVIYPFAVIGAIARKLCSSSYEMMPVSDYDVCYCKNGTAVQRRSSSLQNSLVKKSPQSARQ